MKFMEHDKWANVLFLHWRVPPNLEPVLQTDCGPFAVDRTPDGSAWIGLVLLTERNVGPPILRERTCVTHHGANVRTYVAGGGVHFSSLECDDRLAAAGANFFGMPYVNASIGRRYGLERAEDGVGGNGVIAQELETCDTRDRAVCGDGPIVPRLKKFRFASCRSAGKPTIFNLVRSLFFEYGASLHRTELHLIGPPGRDGERECCVKGGGGDGAPEKYFSVTCEWERRGTGTEDTELAEFLTERYFVYTRKYGLNWRGEVEHGPWPVEEASLTNLSISGVDSYEPATIRPLIAYMAKNRPDSVMFSPGVGPVRFNMLRPVYFTS